MAIVIGDLVETALAGEVQKRAAGLGLFEAREAIDASNSAVTPLASRRFVGRVI